MDPKIVLITKSDAKTFHDNRVDVTSAGDLTKDLLKNMQITAVGDIITILKNAKPNVKPQSSRSHNTKTLVKVPELHAEITHPDLRKFRIDWEVYKEISNTEPSQIPAQL